MSITKWIAKKYILSLVNGLLDQYKDDVGKTTATLAKWIGRLSKVLRVLNNLNAKFDDGKIDSDEVEDSVSEITALVKEW